MQQADPEAMDRATNQAPLTQGGRRPRSALRCCRLSGQVFWFVLGHRTPPLSQSVSEHNKSVSSTPSRAAAAVRLLALPPLTCR